MTRFGFTQVDVFTDVALLGNPLAVVHEADKLDSARMQAFASWTNLSETTFLLTPRDSAADYRVRIFTPSGELPFAGHPTLGSCHAWLERGGVPKNAGTVMQECEVGLISIRSEAGGAAFAAPPLKTEPVASATLAPVLIALGLRASDVRAASWLDNGPRWLGLLLGGADAVLAVEPDHGALKTLPKIGVIGAHLPGLPVDFEVRAFAASIGVNEDPVTGSLNAGLAGWLIEAGHAPEQYRVAQGTRLGRAGRVHIERRGSTIWVGGSTVTCVKGDVLL